MMGYASVDRDSRGRFTSERVQAARQAESRQEAKAAAAQKRADDQQALITTFLTAAGAAGLGYLLGRQGGPGEQQQQAGTLGPAPGPAYQAPHEVFSTMLVATGSTDVPSAPEGYLLEISQVQLAVYGGLDDPPMKGDYINLVARTTTMGSVEPALTRPLLTCRGTLVNDPEARVEQWLEMAGPPLTYDASGWRPVKSLAPNFVTVQAPGPMLFDSNVPVWVAAIITTAGVRATAFLLYRYVPVPVPGFTRDAWV